MLLPLLLPLCQLDLHRLLAHLLHQVQDTQIAVVIHIELSLVLRKTEVLDLRGHTVNGHHPALCTL